MGNSCAVEGGSKGGSGRLQLQAGPQPRLHTRAVLTVTDRPTPFSCAWCVCIFCGRPGNGGAAGWRGQAGCKRARAARWATACSWLQRACEPKSPLMLARRIERSAPLPAPPPP